MTNSRSRLLAGILVPLAIGGTIAGCGDGKTADGGSGGAAAEQTTPPAEITASAADVDKAFVRQMVPHHLMAVEMAEMAEGRAEQDEIKQLSVDIISAQQQEIEELGAIAEKLAVTPDQPTSGASGHGAAMGKDAATLGLSMEQMGMSMNMASLKTADPFDKAFIDEMTAHHKGAVAMAKAQLASGENADLKTISTAIVAAQEKELAQMAAWRKQWYGADGGEPASAHDGHSMPGT